MAPSKMTRKEEVSEDIEAQVDVPLMELSKSNPGVRRLMAKGKERGYVTYDELNEALPQDQLTSDQIDEAMTMIADMGISIVDSDEEVDDSLVVTQAEPSPRSEFAFGDEEAEEVEDTAGRTDDPVRMYLREMGNVELLSRDGEIAIAKRIESGKEMMLGGLAESPVTAKAIIHWFSLLGESKILLRDIITIDTNSGFDEDASEDDDEASVPEETVAEAVEAIVHELSDYEASMLPKIMAQFDDYVAMYNKLNTLRTNILKDPKAKSLADHK
ncbi:MAG: RNA polymerase sigma factor RpoD, partial [Alphaproteobacteria bacterium]|nr:RNA polymerase sigma factor RpoD [Alphaproteobacteria bacterium]